MNLNWEFNGMPLHPLFVHFAVVAVLVAAICTILSAVWPAARRRLGIITPIIAFLSLISVLLSKEAGETLQRQLPDSELIDRHAELADSLVPWVVGVLLIAAIQWAWFRYFVGADARFGRTVSSPLVRRVVPIVLAVLAVVVAAGSSIVLLYVGDSGAQTVWLKR